MKKSLILVGLVSAFMFTGCSSKKIDGDAIQKKMEDHGWEIKLDDTENQFIMKIHLDEDVKFDIGYLKHDKEYDIISFNNEVSNVEYSASYDIRDKITYGLVVITGEDGVLDQEFHCQRYDLDNDQLGDTVKYKKAAKCSVDEISKLKETKKMRDNYLKDADLSMQELVDWVEWMIDKNIEK